MAVILKNSVYIHIPKTGGRWTEKVLLDTFPGAIYLCGNKTGGHETKQEIINFQKNGFSKDQVSFYSHQGEIKESHDRVARKLEALDFNLMQYFSFVRDPIDFWKSYWRYRMSTFWVNDHRVDKVCQSDTFTDFVDKLLQFIPGDCTRVYNTLIPPDCSWEFTVGKFENLQNDLVIILKDLEGDFNEKIIFNTPVVNATDKEIYSTELDTIRKQKLYESEIEAYTRFAYRAEIHTS